MLNAIALRLWGQNATIRGLAILITKGLTNYITKHRRLVHKKMEDSISSADLLNSLPTG